MCVCVCVCVCVCARARVRACVRVWEGRRDAYLKNQDQTTNVGMIGHVSSEDTRGLGSPRHGPP